MAIHPEDASSEKAGLDVSHPHKQPSAKLHAHFKYHTSVSHQPHKVFSVALPKVHDHTKAPSEPPISSSVVCSHEDPLAEAHGHLISSVSNKEELPEFAEHVYLTVQQGSITTRIKIPSCQLSKKKIIAIIGLVIEIRDDMLVSFIIHTLFNFCQTSY